MKQQVPGVKTVSSFHEDEHIGEVNHATTQDQSEGVFASRYSERKGWLLRGLQGVWFLSGAVRPAWMRW